MENSISTDQFLSISSKIEAELSKMIVGQKDVIRHVLIALLAGGHVLLEGVPGLGKTILIRTLGKVLDLKFSRIQFTPDLMPADITGTHILIDQDGKREFRFQPGPVFANLVLADEINRATPKTQSALLEAMQEHSVTVADHTYHLEEPFFVLATQNPLEMEGTYPLPEAQLDRFFFKVNVNFPSTQELVDILTRTTSSTSPQIESVASGKDLISLGELTRQVPTASHISHYAASLIIASHPSSPDAPPLVKKYVRYGSSPRGAQALILGAKITALLTGRFNVSFEDINSISSAALRHRLILNFEGLADGIKTDEIINQLVQNVHQSSIKQTISQ